MIYREMTDDRPYPRYDRNLNCTLLRPITARERLIDRLCLIGGYTFTLLLLIVVLLPLARALAAEPIAGRATVIDGDTIEIRSQRIRLWGIDAPESLQRCQGASGKDYRCGKLVADVLDELLAAARPTRCDPVDVDRYKRVVARCYAGKLDVAEALVKRGLAIDYRQYSKGAYAAAEDAARSRRLGLWAGTFETPREWRRRGR
jgi:endonuclease YncB( thermonuclease family)